jgi:hypothetical protein
MSLTYLKLTRKSRLRGKLKNTPHKEFRFKYKSQRMDGSMKTYPEYPITIMPNGLKPRTNVGRKLDFNLAPLLSSTGENSPS